MFALDKIQFIETRCHRRDVCMYLQQCRQVFFVRSYCAIPKIYSYGQRDDGAVQSKICRIGAVYEVGLKQLPFYSTTKDDGIKASSAWPNLTFCPDGFVFGQ